MTEQTSDRILTFILCLVFATLFVALIAPRNLEVIDYVLATLALTFIGTLKA